MKTDTNSRNVILIAMMVVLLILAVFVNCKGGSTTSAHIPEDTEYMQKLHWYDETLRAYNHLFHRVWIDRPNYVEDVLVETDEFIELDSLMNGHWADTFEFYSKDDSIAYHNNWWNEAN